MLVLLLLQYILKKKESANFTGNSRVFYMTILREYFNNENVLLFPVSSRSTRKN